MGKNMESKKTKKKKEKPWKPLQKDSLARIRTFSHFISKGVNTNSFAFGVRLSPEDRIDLPCVALRTMDIRTIPLESLNGATFVPFVQQFSWVKEKMEGLETSSEYFNVKEEDVQTIVSAFPDLERRYESPEDFVGLRLRQIIVRTETGEDVCLTPLPSPGFSHVLGQRLREERETYGQKDEDKGKTPSRPVMIPRNRGFLGIGGSNTQNVGFLTHALQTVLFCKAPTEDKDIRTVYALRFGKKEIFFSTSLLREFYRWRQGVLRSHRGIMPGDADIREQERDFLVRIVADLKQKSADNAALVEKHQESASDTMDDPWLNPALRDGEWVEREARKIYRTLLDAAFFEHGQEVTLHVGEQDSLRWISVIEEVLS